MIIPNSFFFNDLHLKYGQGPFHMPYSKGKPRIQKLGKSQKHMDPMSIFVIEILRFRFGFGYFINFTKAYGTGPDRKVFFY